VIANAKGHRVIVHLEEGVAVQVVDLEAEVFGDAEVMSPMVMIILVVSFLLLRSFVYVSKLGVLAPTFIFSGQTGSSFPQTLC
jgi:hypothetical protein